MDLTLHQKQGVALQSKASEILFGGAAGPGKSHLLRVAAIIWCAMVPGLQVYLFRRTYTDLFKNHMTGPTGFPALLAEWVLEKRVKFNYSKNYIEFWNGSKIFLCHCQHEKDVYNYQGAEIHVLLIDELTHFLEDMYRYLRGRVRLGGLRVPPEYEGHFPRIVNGTNPGGLGHNWVKQTFVSNAPPYVIKRMEKKEGGMLRQFIPAWLIDNPTLAETDPDYADRLEGLGSPELVRAMLAGDWDIVAGGMFDDVWDRNVHAIEPFEIPSSWRIDRSFDWGSSKPFSVGWWAESDGTRAPNGRHYPRGSLFRIAEWYGWNGKANQGTKMLSGDIAKGILEREAQFSFLGFGQKIIPGPADASIFDVEDGVSIGEGMARAGVRWVKADKGPGSRKNGWERMREYLMNAKETRPEKPGLWVFNTCTDGFIRTVPVLARDERKPDDVNTEAEDHAADEARYRVSQRTGHGTVSKDAASALAGMDD